MIDGATCLASSAFAVVILMASLPAAGRMPAELDIPYSPGNPPGPAFQDEQKQRQLAEGRRIRLEIVAAFKAGRESYTIPPGNYRFDSRWKAVDGDSFALQDLHGDPEKPFRILGHGATFWFNLTDRPMPSAHQMIKIIDCSHITLEGLTVDSDPRGCMDARITAFDFEGNRIQVQPVLGTRLIQTPPSEPRFIPYKANGHHISSLYRIDDGWGPGNVFYEKLERTADGRYWLTMKNRKLLETARSDRWRKTFGPEGTLEVGDMLGLLYSTSNAIALSNCKQITIRDCRFYAAKAGLSESGGYGAHQWIDCSFMARPGSNNLLGGDGTMNNACMHGSTFDGRIVQRTTDDCFNNHGYWQRARAVTPTSITFEKDPPAGLAPGHVAEVYDPGTQRFLGSLTVQRVEGRTVWFKEPVGERCAGAALMFTAFQNAGWVIRNSTFIDCYQRIRLCCGPGVFENNRIERVGSSLVVDNCNMRDIEGGVPDEVIIRNNVFVDSAVSPPSSVIEIVGRGRPRRNIQVVGNLFCNSGQEAVSVTGADGLVLRDNVILHPFKGHAAMPDAGPAVQCAVTLKDVRNATVSDNVVVRPAPADGPEVVQTGCDAVQMRGNRTMIDPPRRVEELVRQWTQTHDTAARAIIERVRSELARQ